MFYTSGCAVVLENDTPDIEKDENKNLCDYCDVLKMPLCNLCIGA